MLIQKNTSIAANATNDNVNSGDQYEFAPFRSIVEVGLNQSVTGLEVDVLCGSRSISTRIIPLIKTTAPIWPDDFLVKFGAQRGERVIVRARNTTAGAINLLSTTKYNPV